MLKRLFFAISIFSLMSVAGCFSFNFGFPTDGNGGESDDNVETVLTANTNNFL